MNKVIKKGLAVLLGAFAVMAAGCQAGGDKAPGEVRESAGKSSEKGGESGSGALTIASFNRLITEEFIEAFNRKYPEVELDVISYAGHNGSGYAMHTLENGDIPDIYVTSQNFGKEYQGQYLLDLSTYDFVNHYASTLLDSISIDGGIYLLPSGYQLTGIYYNKTILEEHGWSVPDSFEELVSLSQEIQAAGYQTMGHGMSLDGYPFNYFFNIGNTMYFGTPQGTEWKERFPRGEAQAFGDSRLKETAEYFEQWVDNGFITAEHMETEEFFEGGSVFFLCLGITEYEHTTEDGKTYEFGTMPWLSPDGGSNMLTRTVSRYIGLNRSLKEDGNEKKLENALKFMEYVSTAEGQQALMTSSNQYMPSLNESILSEDSPYQEIAYLVEQGRTVPLLYVGWENQVIPIAQEIKKLISGDTDVDSMLEEFDRINRGLLDGSSEDIFARAERTLTMEETARLVAMAEGKAAGADCAMISLNQYHGDDCCNEQGLGWYLYEGDINTDIVNMIRPRSVSISVLEMTGQEIEAMAAAGFDQDGNGNPYEYLLFTKGDMELEDGTVYRLAAAEGELTEEMAGKAQTVEMSLPDAIKEYLRELGIVTGEERWE